MFVELKFVFDAEGVVDCCCCAFRKVLDVRPDVPIGVGEHCKMVRLGEETTVDHHHRDEEEKQNVLTHEIVRRIYNHFLPIENNHVDIPFACFNLLSEICAVDGGRLIDNYLNCLKRAKSPAYSNATIQFSL